MKITVIGASAGVGLEVVKRALQRGHEVTTLSRRIETLPEHPLLHKVQGSSLKVDDVRQALQGAEAVLVTLGTGMSTKPTTLFTDSARVLLQVLQESEVKPPLLILSGFGAGESWDYNGFIAKLFFRFVLKDVYADKSLMEQMIAAAYPRSEMVRPGLLTNGIAREIYRVQDELSKGMKVSWISRQDVAHFMVIEAEQPQHLGKCPALSY